MRYVKATNLSASEAEDIIATIWIALEKHGLSSPKITIFSRSTKREIEFVFELERDESLIAAELPGIMSRNIKALAIGGKFKGLSALVVSEPELYTVVFDCLSE
jgi:hypothetical protein